MKFSVVTISFNQAEFLERAILSVIGQTGVDIEYIIVDAGSNDGSRDIIKKYEGRFKRVITEKDKGPADGLNNGFSCAEGDIYCYLNSDDVFDTDAFSRISSYFSSHPDVDVVCGHAWIIDGKDNRLRRVWSEPFRPLPVAYGASIQIQPSTFIRREAFLRSGGFNVENSSNWDGELLVDLHRSGARLAIIDAFLSGYRLHDVSITVSGRLDEQITRFHRRRFEKMMGRPFRMADRPLALLLRLAKHVTRPRALLERLRYGPIHRRRQE